jgi:hypothetical protein
LATAIQVRLGKLERWTPAMLLTVALLVRVSVITEAPLWSDEAESTINALNICKDGVPRETHLGIPIFENTLVEKWVGHPEYEFRDISYTDRGLAVYHGWLPLYSIAGALGLAGMAPDRNGVMPLPQTPDEMRRWTYVPRIPAVVFGLISLAAMFLAARRLYDVSAGWAVLVLGALHLGHVFLTTSARYYGATLAMHALSGWLMIAAFQDGRTRYFAGLALALVALFHSHLVTFAAACGALALLLPWMVRRSGFAKNLVLLAAIVAAGTVPWLAATGFLHHSVDIPRGWDLLSLPGDLLIYPRRQPVFAGLYLIGLVALGCAVAFRKGRTRLRAAFGERIGEFVWLYGWMTIAYAIFLLFMPAASFFYARITVPVLVPALLLASVFLAASLRTLSAPAWATIPAAIALLWAANTLFRPVTSPAPDSFAAIQALVGTIRQESQPGTRFYGTPNDHLILTYYSGVPVQSIAPIRKEFFETYTGRIVLFEKAGSLELPQPWRENPIFRGFSIKETSDWWKVFFYRFVDPVSRGGARLNYKDRKQGQKQSPVSGWVMRTFPPLQTESK